MATAQRMGLRQLSFTVNIPARLTLSVLLSVTLVASVSRAQIFVSPDGNDLDSGTIEQPYLTITKAHSVAAPGDTIFLRGGVYDSLLTTITISKSGSRSTRYYLLAYPGERPILDFSLMPVDGANRGIRITGIYWYVRGIDIRGAGDNGMHVSGSYNIIEFCSFYENHDTGLQISSGASNNQVVNCDSYHNVDPSQGNADGFAAKLDVGTGNSFHGCRAWENSDDGYDGYLRPSNDVSTVLENCWIFKNGYLPDGSASTGNGNGFKLGGSDDRTLRHHVVLRNCVAFDNRVKGFDQNNDRGSMTLYNCTGYRNGTNYSIPGPIDTGQTLTVVNCVALGSFGVLGSFAVQQTNSWLPPFSVTASDFVSIDTAGVRGPRKVDGSLPDVSFLHLVEGSDLVDAGTDVGIPFKGLAPDLGAFESDPPTGILPVEHVPARFSVLGNYPNPFNPSTTIAYEIPGSGLVTITIFDLLGRRIRRLAVEQNAAGRYQAVWNGTDDDGRGVSSGTYYATIQYRGVRSALKMQLLR